MVTFNLNEVFFSFPFGSYNCEIDVFISQDTRFNAPLHFHNGIEIFMNIEGNVIYIIDENKRVELTDNMYIVLGKNVAHREFVIPKQNQKSYCFGFYFKKSNSEMNEYAKSEGDMLYSALMNVTYVTGTIDPKLLSLFDEIIVEFNNKKPGYYNKIQVLFSQIIIEICRLCINDREFSEFSAPSKNIQDKKYRICEYFFGDIYFNKMVDYSINTLAKRLYLSERQTNRLIHELYNMSFSKKVDITIIERSADLLKNSDLSIGEISSKVGFENLSYFCEKFKKYMGCSPIYYRKQQNNKP